MPPPESSLPATQGEVAQQRTALCFDRDILARTLPFALYMLVLALRDLFPPAVALWLYPVQVGLAALAMAVFWRSYRELHVREQHLSFASAAFVLLAGAGVFAIWIRLDLPWLSLPGSEAVPPPMLGDAPDWRWVAVRLMGAAIVVPLMEELFWRAFVMRWLEARNFMQVAAASVSWRSVLLSSLVFGLEHHLWFAGLLAGLVYAWLYRRCGLWAAIVSHGITNLMLGLWVLYSGAVAILVRLGFARLPRLKWLACLLVLSSLPAQAYMTDFSERLVEQMQQRFGASARPRLENWGQSLESLKGNEMQLLTAVNSLANRAPWSSDPQSWGEVDYWATPAEFISRNTGDCEDFVIAKYYSLLALGVERSRLRLVYVRAFMDGQLTPHMVLAWYARPDAEPLLLDNLNPRLLSASQRPDLSPLFSISEAQAVPAHANTRTRQISDVTLSRWSALQKRVALERD